jgi:hypothetical protein
MFIKRGHGLRKAEEHWSRVTTVEAYFKKLSWHTPGEAEENNENFSHDIITFPRATSRIKWLNGEKKFRGPSPSSSSGY